KDFSELVIANEDRRWFGGWFWRLSWRWFGRCGASRRTCFEVVILARLAVEGAVWVHRADRNIRHPLSFGKFIPWTNIFIVAAAHRNGGNPFTGLHIDPALTWVMRHASLILSNCRPREKSQAAKTTSETISKCGMVADPTFLFIKDWSPFIAASHSYW